jgi:hypothetical protein
MELRVGGGERERERRGETQDTLQRHNTVTYLPQLDFTFLGLHKLP